MHSLLQLQVFDSNKDGKLQLSDMAKWVSQQILKKYVLQTIIAIKDLEVDDDFEVNEGMEVDDLALPEEVQLIFLYRKKSLNQAAILLIKFEFN